MNQVVRSDVVTAATSIRCQQTEREQVGEVLALRALGVEGHHLDAARDGRLGDRVQERLPRLLGQPTGQRQPVGQPLGGGEHARPEPAGGAERHHVGRATAVGRRAASVARALPMITGALVLLVGIGLVVRGLLLGG